MIKKIIISLTLVLAIAMIGVIATTSTMAQSSGSTGQITTFTVTPGDRTLTLDWNKPGPFPNCPGDDRQCTGSR